MDQVRVALAWMQKHHFWLLSGLAAILALTGWYLGTGSLATAYTADKGKIDKSFSDVDAKNKLQFHPNEDVNKAQGTEVTKLRDDVGATWTSLYDRQRTEALQWPKQLNQQFQDYIAALKFGSEIRPDMREQYTNYIEGRFADLPKIINANPLTTTGTGGAAPGGRGGFGGGRGGFAGGRGGGFGAGPSGPQAGTDEVEENYTVFWADQERVQLELTWPETGSNWRIWATQEDLWVYEKVLKAVAATNTEKGAERRANAAVRSIYALEIGKLAAVGARGTGRVTPLAVASAAGEEGTGAEFSSGGRGGQESPGEGAEDLGDGRGGPEGEGAEKSVFLSGRYIDGEGKGIPVPGGEEPLDLTLFGTEFKRLPVRLDIEVDQRWLPFLIVQLANAPLEIEVQEVRINPSETGSSGMGGRGGLSSAGGGSGARGAGGFGGGAAMMVDEVQVFGREPYVKRVILQGVVYIFNEPDPAKLQLEGGEEAATDTTAAL